MQTNSLASVLSRPRFMQYLALIILSFSVSSTLFATDPGFVPGKIILEFDPGIIPSGLTTGIPDIDALLSTFDVQSIIRVFQNALPNSDIFDRWWILQFPDWVPVDEIAPYFQGIAGITYVELDNLYVPASLPNDPEYSSQWNLHNTGQSQGTAGADINAPGGWAYFSTIPESHNVTVAFIDTGIQAGQADLQQNTLGETRIVAGYNSTGDGNPTSDTDDTCGHGTHCAGLLAANWNNDEIAGIDSRCKIMPVRVCNRTACTCDTASIAAGISWAAANGANVISMSLQCYGTSCPSACPTGNSEYQAIAAARNLGITVVSAAGNSGAGWADISSPGCFDNVITVGATDDTDKRSTWNAYAGFESSATGKALDVMALGGSGYPTSEHWIPDVDAPCTAISGCNTNETTFAGTSAATPQVAGIAALLIALNGALSPDDIECILKASADDLVGPSSGDSNDIDSPGRDDNYGWGRVNMGRAFSLLQNHTAPSAPQLTTPANGATGQEWNVTLQWQKSTLVDGYDVYFGDSNPPATVVSTANETLSYTVNNLLPGKTYYWKVKANGCQGASTTSSVYHFTTKDGPYIVLDSFGTPQEVDGDHDAYMEAGELWKLSVTVRNTGTLAATDATAQLQGTVTGSSLNPIYVYNNNNVNYGYIAVNATATCAYVFKPDPTNWYGTKIACGSNIIFSLIDKSAHAGTVQFDFLDDTDFTNYQVGLATQSQGLTAALLSGIQNSAKTSTFTPVASISGSGTYNATLSIDLRGVISLPGPTTKSPPVQCGKIDLLWTNGTTNASTTLKNYCCPNPTNYDISSFYQTHQAGTYTISITESSTTQACSTMPSSCRGTSPGSSTCTGSLYTNGAESVEIIMSQPNACQTSTVMGVYPPLGTAAGGTNSFIYGPAGSFPDSTIAIGFDAGNTCPTNNTVTGTTVWADSGDITWIDTQNVEIKTPTMPSEGTASLVVDNDPTTPTTFDLCATSKGIFDTLAFTANQVGQNISIVDTTQNALFVPKNSLPFSESIVPLGIAYNKGLNAGRTLMVVDAYEGNLHFYDVSNFAFLSKLVIQDPEYTPGVWNNYGAIDVMSGASGDFAYVAHMTYGGPALTILGEPYNPVGSISVVGLTQDACSTDTNPTPPCLIDMNTLDDGTSNDYTTPGAPPGITRIEPPSDWGLVPLSIADAFVPKAQQTDYAVGERYPGEYLFVSGVGPAEWGWIPPLYCEPGGQRCPPVQMLEPRPVQVAVVDLNPYIVTGFNGGVMQTTNNPCYRQFTTKVDFGSNGQFYSTQGLSFSSASVYNNVQMYAVNPNENTAADILFNPDNLPTPTDPNNCVYLDLDPSPITLRALITVGDTPDDVKVQTITIPGSPPVEKIYAYVTNADDDTVSVLDTSTDTQTALFQQDLCNTRTNLYPTSIDTRSLGDRAYSSDYHLSKVSVFNLLTGLMNSPTCEIGNIGGSPIKIVVNPAPNSTDISMGMQTLMSFATPPDMTDDATKFGLLKDWEHVQNVEQSHASAQAVQSALKNCQKKAEKAARKDSLRKKY